MPFGFCYVDFCSLSKCSCFFCVEENTVISPHIYDLGDSQVWQIPGLNLFIYVNVYCERDFLSLPHNWPTLPRSVSNGQMANPWNFSQAEKIFFLQDKWMCEGLFIYYRVKYKAKVWTYYINKISFLWWIIVVKMYLCIGHLYIKWPQLRQILF